MRRFVDLHTHSTASDGWLGPSELVALAEAKRLVAVALTDHDTVAGLPQAARAARGLALRLIPGVEVSAPTTGEGVLHLVGLGIDPACPAVRDMLRAMRTWRRDRNRRIVARLQALGLPVTMAELLRFAGATGRRGAVVGRLHIANLLRTGRLVGDVEEAFQRYLRRGAPAYVEKDRLPSRRIIATIHSAGGLAVLAHPGQMKCANSAQLERVVRGLASEGLDGLEVYHPEHTDAQTRAYLDLARRLRLLVSGGSDFHGSAKPDARLGRPRVPVEAVGQLLARLRP